MLTNTDCTLYHFNKLTQGYDRYYLSAVMWQESRTQKICGLSEVYRKYGYGSKGKY